MKTNLLKKYRKYFVLTLLFSLNICINFTPDGITIGMKQTYANAIDYSTGYYWLDYFLNNSLYDPSLYVVSSSNGSYTQVPDDYTFPGQIATVFCYGKKPTSVPNPVNLSTSVLWWWSAPQSTTTQQWRYWNDSYNNGAGGWQTVSGGTSGTPESQSATRINANPNVTPSTVHVSGVSDNANAAQNLTDAANGQLVHTSCYGNAPCTTVSLKITLLSGVETLAQSFTLSISEIAGGSHSANSSHYSGMAIDVNMVNNQYVSQMSEQAVNAFRNAAFAAGASVVYGPYHDPYGGHSNHFHIQWEPTIN
ncbi:MAG: hypothetical protein C0397_19610 [Odoribacter sp.]|nr:hypothetical protein [Odoribacter sp.]